jgi:preprotein translocase subunit SecG
MQTVLIVVHLMIVLALVGVVLIQRSEGGGLGIGGGSGFMSARGTANALTRTTAILALLFFVTSLGLGLLARYQSKPTDILDRLPTTTTTDGLLDSLAPAKTEEKKVAPADPNAIPLGDDQSNATTPAVDTTPAATTATEEKPATATATDSKPADAATSTEIKPADAATTPTTEEKPAQQ